jgi:O-antigen/teichoic acid export membrane protein
MIRLLYPPEYKDAIWMQKWLVLTIVLSFLNNLFAYVMMTDGGQKPLLFFSLTTLLVNLALNHFLVSSLGLLGGCLVIILTKLTMTTLTLGYCQMRFKLFTVRDFAFPTALGLGCLAGFHALAPGLGVHIAAFLALAAHGLGVLYGRRRFLGPPLGRYAA